MEQNDVRRPILYISSSKKKEFISLHGVYRKNSRGRAYLFLPKTEKINKRIWSVKNVLPIPNGQRVYIEGIIQDERLYIKKAHFTHFPRRKKTPLHSNINIANSLS